MTEETNYYEVIPRLQTGSDVLTYSHTSELSPGQLVGVSVGRRQTFAVVLKKVTRPRFSTKEIPRVLDYYLGNDQLSLAKWIGEYYASPLSQAIGMMVPRRPDISGKLPRQDFEPDDAPELTRDQKSAMAKIKKAHPAPCLLHGATGSGKTEIYMRLAAETLERGQSVIILTPEITLATQAIGQFTRRFEDNLLLTHSGLSEVERRGIWQKCVTAKDPLVVVGPRSALFLPLKNIGLIVVDEAHEPSYKQDSSPRYHAQAVAEKLSEISGAGLILGSATPSLIDIYRAEQKKLITVNLPQPIHKASRQVEVVDMRRSNSLLSQPLRQAVADALADKEQVLLFLNRRGSASQVVCSQCGWVASCASCHLPQTWHGDIGQLRCHLCGRKDRLAGKCPQCHGFKWRFLGVGTKRVETEVTALFPSARTMRLDRDSFSPKSISDVLTSIRNRDVDIIIGTQMIAKGLDLPDISVVGVVLADTLLHIPDVNSGERTYQLLHQVIGRAGRKAGSASRVVIQTYSQDALPIQMAAEQDYAGFAEAELTERRSLGYPPFSHQLKLICKRKTAKGAETAGSRLARQLERDYHDKVTVRGPAPAWWERRAGHYFWHIILSSQDRKQLVEIARNLPANWQYDLDPVDLL